MSKFIQLKSKNFQIVNVDNIKSVEEIKNRLKLRYICTNDDEFIEKFSTEEELQERIKILKEKLLGEINIGINFNQKPINRCFAIEDFVVKELLEQVNERGWLNCERF